jgi:hypothetical protein
VKRYAMWALAAIVVIWVVQNPASAAHVIHAVTAALGHAARSLSALAGGI